MEIKKATLNDIDLLIKLRLDYIAADTGPLSLNQKQDLTAALSDYFKIHLADHTLLAVYAQIDGSIAAVAFLVITEMPPNPTVPDGLIGTLLNVLTYPDYRRQGLATKLIRELLSEAEHRGITSVRLSATAAGKAVYEKLGFQISKYTSMEIQL